MDVSTLDYKVKGNTIEYNMELKDVLFTKTGKPKCWICGKVMKQDETKYDFKPGCKCMPKNLRLSVG